MKKDDSTISPRVLAYEFEQYRIYQPAHLPESLKGKYCVSNGDRYINDKGELQGTFNWFDTFPAALTAMLRYEDSVRPEGEMRVVPWCGGWDNQNGWTITDRNRNYLTKDGQIHQTADRWDDLEAVTLALLDYRAKLTEKSYGDGTVETMARDQTEKIAQTKQAIGDASLKTEAPARQWDVGKVAGGWIVSDGNGNFISIAGSRLTVTKDSQQWLEPLAICLAFYANAHGPHPPEPDVWEVEHCDEQYLSEGWKVKKNGLTMTVFYVANNPNAEHDAREYVKGKRDVV